MSNQFNIQIKGIKEFEAAIKRNPRAIKKGLSNFFTEALALYNRGIIRQPWRVGSGGGGSPVDTGHLRDTHQTEIKPWEAAIYPSQQVPYAVYVHGRDGDSRGRPWMTYVFNKNRLAIAALQDNLLKFLVKDLAK